MFDVDVDEDPPPRDPKRSLKASVDEDEAAAGLDDKLDVGRDGLLAGVREREPPLDPFREEFER